MDTMGIATGYDQPATGKQLHTLALLCMKLGIHDPVEETHLTVGTAGKLIRRLSSEKKLRIFPRQ